MTSQELNIIGLTSDIIGVLLLFKYGLPADLNKDGANVIEFQGTNIEEQKKWKRYNIWSKIGLCFIIVGFTFQIFSNLISI